MGSTWGGGGVPARQPCHLGLQVDAPSSGALARPRANHQFYSCEDGSPRFINNKKYDDLQVLRPAAPRHPVGSHCALVPGASSAGTVVLTRGGGHCHSCIGLGRAMPLITTFRGCTDPSSIPGPLQPNKYASVSSARLHPVLRPGDCRAANEAQEGASEVQGSPRAQRAPSRPMLGHNDDPEGLAPCSQHSCELVLCGFKQQLGSTSPQNAVASLLSQCPRPTQAGPSVFTKEIINDVTNWTLILTMTQQLTKQLVSQISSSRVSLQGSPQTPSQPGSGFSAFPAGECVLRVVSPITEPGVLPPLQRSHRKTPRLWTEPVKKRLLPTFSLKCHRSF